MCLSPLGTQCSSVCSALRSCIHCAFNLHGTFFFLKMNLMHWKVGKDHFHWITKSRLLWAEPSLTSSVMFSCIVCSLGGGVQPLSKAPFMLSYHNHSYPQLGGGFFISEKMKPGLKVRYAVEPGLEATSVSWSLDPILSFNWDSLGHCPGPSRGNADGALDEPLQPC